MQAKNPYLAERLESLRKARDYTMKEVAERITAANPELEVKEGTYRQYESTRLEPNYNVLSALADFYGVTTDYLLGRDEQPDPVQALPVTDDEKELVDAFVKMQEEDRRAILSARDIIIRSNTDRRVEELEAKIAQLEATIETLEAQIAALEEENTRLKESASMTVHGDYTQNNIAFTGTSPAPSVIDTIASGEAFPMDKP